MRGYLWTNLGNEIFELFRNYGESIMCTDKYISTFIKHESRAKFVERCQLDDEDSRFFHLWSSYRPCKSKKYGARYGAVEKEKGVCSKGACKNIAAEGIKFCQYHREIANKASRKAQLAMVASSNRQVKEKVTNGTL